MIKWDLFFNIVSPTVHTLLPWMLQCLDPIHKKSYQQQIWHNPMNFSDVNFVCLYIYIYIYIGGAPGEMVIALVNGYVKLRSNPRQRCLLFTMNKLLLFVCYESLLFIFQHQPLKKQNILYMCIFPACCFRQRTYMAQCLVNEVLNETWTHSCS